MRWFHRVTDVHTRVPPSRLETRVTVPGEHPLTYLVPVRVAVIIIISVEMRSAPSQGSVNNNPDQLGGLYCVKWFRAPDRLCGSAVVVTYICRPLCPKLSPQSCQLHTLRLVT